MQIESKERSQGAGIDGIFKTNIEIQSGWEGEPIKRTLDFTFRSSLTFEKLVLVEQKRRRKSDCRRLKN